MKSIGETLIFGFKNPEVRYWKGLKECQPGYHNRTINSTHIKNSRIYGCAARTVGQKISMENIWFPYS